MKKVFLFIFIVLLINSNMVFCDDTNGLITDQLDKLDLSKMEEELKELNSQTQGYIPKIDAKKFILGLFSKDKNSSIADTINGIMRFFLKEIIQNMNLLGKILVLSIFCAILQNLHEAFESDTIGKLSYYVCYCLIITIAIGSFLQAMTFALNSIDQMVGFIQSLLPTLLALLIAVGGIASSALFQPIIFVSISVISTVIKTVIIPLILFSAVLAILNNISEKIQISKLSDLIKNISVGVLGLLMTVFIGIISIQGVAASSLDGLGSKTTKFALDNFIPIMGSFLSSAYDTVISCSMIIKNGVGILGLMTLTLIAIVPIIKILSMVLMYKITAALLQPISNNSVVQCLSDIGNALFLLLCSVLAIGLMFFIAITVILGVGNMTVMLR